MHWSFAKYVACGNDFILFDNRKKKFPTTPTLIQRLCNRNYGIGADGLLLWEHNETENGSPFRMRIFNADGSEANMCANGLRCFVKWLAAKEEISPIKEQKPDLFTIAVGDRSWSVVKTEETMCIQMGSPQKTIWDVSHTKKWTENDSFHFLDTGVPHVVLLVSDIACFPLEHFGPIIRNDPYFGLQGTNVTIVEPLSHPFCKVRTYERGVEGETLGCGTGAVAAALAVAYEKGWESAILVETRSKEVVEIGFSAQPHNKLFFDVTLTGSAHLIFEGSIVIAETEGHD